MLFSLVSPEKIVFTGEVDQIDVSGSGGDFGVLDHHAPFMTSLRPGRVILRWKDKPDQTFTIAGGFAEVTPHECVILADATEPEN